MKGDRKLSEGLYTALVLAGDRGPHDPVAEAAGVERKALAEVAGRSMLARVLDSVSGCSRVGRILLVANGVDDFRKCVAARRMAPAAEIEFVEGDATPVRSVERVIDQGLAPFPLVVVGADNPLLTSADLEGFLEAAQASEEAGIVVALAAESDFRTHFPHVPRTFVKLGREGYSGCNLFALHRPAARRALEFWEKIEGQRKKTLRLVAAFGLWSLVRVLFGWMDLKSAFRRASEVLGVGVEPWVSEAPQMAMDVDAPAHLAAVEKLLAERKAGAG